MVEMLVVIAALSVLLSAVSICLHAMNRADLHTRDELRAAESLSRLVLRWRDDVHAAEAVKPDAGGASITLALPGGESVEYRAVAEGVTRTRSRGAAATHRDTFRIGDGHRAAWELSDAEGRRFATLLVSRSFPYETSEQPPPLRVEALLRRSAAITGANQRGGAR